MIRHFQFHSMNAYRSIRYDNSLSSNDFRSHSYFRFSIEANFNPTQTTKRGWRKKSKAESCYLYASTS